MYIFRGHMGYIGSDGQQHTRRGEFLLLVGDKARRYSGREDFRALIRIVALRQLGHFMMGTARVKNRSLTVSGTYGADGLTMDVDPEVFDMAMPVPEILYEAWAHGGGWNSAGAEAEAMRTWAQALLMRQKFKSKFKSEFRLRNGSRIAREQEWVTLVGVAKPDGTMNLDGRPIVRVTAKSTGSIMMNI